MAGISRETEWTLSAERITLRTAVKGHARDSTVRTSLGVIRPSN